MSGITLYLRSLDRHIPISKASKFANGGQVRQSSDLSQIQSRLISRKLPVLYDAFSRLNTHLLSITLADFLPKSLVRAENEHYFYHGRGAHDLPFAHHLVYFPPAIPLAALLPDGTDPLHSPGPPYNHRMWTGGLIRYRRGMLVGDGPRICKERIRNVTQSGSRDGRIHVQIVRTFAGLDSQNLPLDHVPQTAHEDSKDHGDPDDPDNGCCEIRNLVFMQKPPASVSGNAKPDAAKFPKPSSSAPDLSHSLVPTAALLFRFSALTFNAHAIHLDKQYCREVEGRRNLLVHGPLSLLFMTELLRVHLANIEKTELNKGWRERIEEVEYKNLAPLYAEEKMTVCLKQKEEKTWDMWIEGKDGRLAVKGVAKIKA